MTYGLSIGDGGFKPQLGPLSFSKHIMHVTLQTKPNHCLWNPMLLRPTCYGSKISPSHLICSKVTRQRPRLSTSRIYSETWFSFKFIFRTRHLWDCAVLMLNAAAHVAKLGFYFKWFEMGRGEWLIRFAWYMLHVCR